MPDKSLAWLSWRPFRAVDNRRTVDKSTKPAGNEICNENSGARYTMTGRETIYFHSPCFDGIVSAVLVWDFLRAKQGWTQPALRPVNYDLREGWLSSSLEQPCAVVDFLYHHEADFWADHHPTTFLSDSASEDFRRRQNPSLVYDPEAQSCARLLWRHLSQTFDHRNERYRGIVDWADRIDSAQYESVQEAILAPTSALKINIGLGLGDRDRYCEKLVHILREKPLDEVARLPEVKTRYEQAQKLIQAGLERFKKAAWIEPDGIVVFDVDSTGVIINRYAPYYWFPDSLYSAGIVRWEGGAKITAMRNPWRNFETPFLGKIFERLGGGGHQRVGSILLPGAKAREAHALLDRVLSDIRREHKKVKSGARA